ncbi:hypothetical protein [Qipengyuania psychrotolerans]|uniref:Uncharacterized protein n=1 Tax=Qipengyuania psychrotolerans TaxID=2867238 RepID=A0ABX8ZF44_9SPHN|nr:hypothetical protein [Qipengyuania psychrotolerans]QZD87621.1 hypothetical protein K3166_02655 [Qipengyuania psychrotolerans]
MSPFLMIAAGLQLAVMIYVLIVFSGMARNIAKQSESMERIARALERDRTL